MPNVLIAYATKNGSTAEIAAAIADEIGRHDIDVDCMPAGDVRDVTRYDAVVLGSAVYMKRWQRSARHLLRHHRHELAERPLWIFSSGPVGKDPDPSWAEPPRVVDQAERLGVRDHVVFGGRMPLEPANFVERAMVQDTPEDLRDARDFDEIRGWARGIAEAVTTAVVA
jgi:menaquinone-dependent protoporphyrinogen oxidase